MTFRQVYIYPNALRCNNSYVYMDTNNHNKSLICIKMRHVNTSSGRFWSIMAHSERNFTPKERGGLCWSVLRLVSMFWSCLPGWGKIILVVHICPSFPRHGSSQRVPLCSSSVNCIACHNGLDICYITMNNTEQRELPASHCRVGHSSYVCPITFEPLKMRRSDIAMPVIPKWLKDICKSTACRKVVATRLFVLALCAAQAGATVTFLGSKAGSSHYSYRHPVSNVPLIDNAYV